MNKHHKADGPTPKTALRELVHKFRSTPDNQQSRRIPGKVLSAVIVGGTAVAIGHPLMTGAGAEQEPAAASAQVQAVNQAAVPAPAAAPIEVQAPAEAPAPQPAPTPAPQATPPHPVTKSLDVDYQAQKTGYWCGPAAARIALSSSTDQLPSQSEMASVLGTTQNGTDHISQVVDGLNEQLAGTGVHYETKEWGGRPVTQEMTDELWQDTVRNVNDGKAMVANIVAKPGNQPPGYPSSKTIYHYVTIVGYNEADKTVHIADPAQFGGYEDYWLPLDQLASLIQLKGYTA